MNERELAGALYGAADALGLDLWAVASRLDESEQDVASAFAGRQGFTVDLLVRIAFTLGLEVDWRPASPVPRPVGPIPSVVDRAIERLTPRVAEMPPSAGAVPESAPMTGEKKPLVEPRTGETP